MSDAWCFQVLEQSKSFWQMETEASPDFLEYFLSTEALLHFQDHLFA